MLCEIAYSKSIHSSQCTFHGFIKDLLQKRNVCCCELHERTKCTVGAYLVSNFLQSTCALSKNGEKLVSNQTDSSVSVDEQQIKESRGSWQRSLPLPDLSRKIEGPLLAGYLSPFSQFLLPFLLFPSPFSSFLLPFLLVPILSLPVLAPISPCFFPLSPSSYSHFLLFLSPFSKFLLPFLLAAILIVLVLPSISPCSHPLFPSSYLHFSLSSSPLSQLFFPFLLVPNPFVPLPYRLVLILFPSSHSTFFSFLSHFSLLLLPFYVATHYSFTFLPSCYQKIRKCIEFACLIGSKSSS